MIFLFLDINKFQKLEHEKGDVEDEKRDVEDEKGDVEDEKSILESKEESWFILK